MRLLQLSDPHLLADPGGVYRQVQPLARLRLALEQADRQPHDLLLLLTDGHISVETVMRSPLAPWGEAAVAVRSARTRAVSAVA